MTSEPDENMRFTREEIVRIFNDAFRLTMGGKVQFSDGFAALGGMKKLRLYEVLCTSTVYTGTEQQQALHERGEVTAEGVTVVWEITYEDGCDPADVDWPFQKRMLSFKLADEE